MSQRNILCSRKRGLTGNFGATLRCKPPDTIRGVNCIVSDAELPMRRGSARAIKEEDLDWLRALRQRPSNTELITPRIRSRVLSPRRRTSSPPQSAAEQPDDGKGDDRGQGWATVSRSPNKRYYFPLSDLPSRAISTHTYKRHRCFQ